MSRKAGTADESDGLGRIRIAVELDSGDTEQEVAERLGIPVSVVREVATSSGFREKQGTPQRSRRTSEAERSVAVSRIALATSARLPTPTILSVTSVDVVIPAKM
jgi:uncharacterized membrane protein